MWTGGHMFGPSSAGLFGFVHLLWWALLVAGVVVLVRWLVRTGWPGGGSGEGRALSILKDRYARGEIDKVEFEARKRDIA